MLNTYSLRWWHCMMVAQVQVEQEQQKQSHELWHLLAVVAELMIAAWSWIDVTARWCHRWRPWRHSNVALRRRWNVCITIVFGGSMPIWAIFWWHSVLLLSWFCCACDKNNMVCNAQHQMVNGKIPNCAVHRLRRFHLYHQCRIPTEVPFGASARGGSMDPYYYVTNCTYFYSTILYSTCTLQQP